MSSFPDDVAKGEDLSNLFSEMIALEFDLLAKPCEFFEGLGIGDGDGRVVGKCSKPSELVLVDMDATEHSQDAQGLALEDQRLAGERDDSFGRGPLGPVNRRIRCQISRHERWCSGAPDQANFPDVERYATEISSEPVPIPARVDGVPGARQQVKAARLVRALGSHKAGGADIAGGDQPDACQGDAWLGGQPIDDALKHEIDRSRFGDGERDRLECSRFHSALMFPIPEAPIGNGEID